MSLALRQRLFEEINSWTIVDPHTHINALQPASTTLADLLATIVTPSLLLGRYAREHIEQPGLSPKEKVSLSCWPGAA